MKKTIVDRAADFVLAVERVFGERPRLLDGSRAVQLGDVRTPAQPHAVQRPPTRLDVSATTGQVDASSFVRRESVVRALQSLPARDSRRLGVSRSV